MKKIKLSHFEFEYNPIMNGVFDEKQNIIVFLSKNYDEIHLIVELKGATIAFHPRWNINIVTDKEHPNKYILDVNYSDEAINLDGCPMKE